MASFSKKQRAVAIHKEEDCKLRKASSLPSRQDTMKVWRPKTKGNTTETSISKSQDDLESKASVSLGCSSDHLLNNAQIAKYKPKKCSASTGTVAGLLGREYVKPRLQPSKLCDESEPVKLHLDDFPACQIWDGNMELDSSSRSGSETMNHNIENFLSNMLGDGFQLEMSVIQDVVVQCGYNMQMCVEKLLDLSVATLEKSDDVTVIAARSHPEKSLEKSLDLESAPFIDFSEGRGELLLPQREKQKNGIQCEVLETLFNVPDRIEKNQKPNFQIRQECQRSLYGHVVTKPLEETVIEDFTFITRRINNRDDEANGSSYEDLRKTAMECWVTMKEYYKAAVAAFAMKDHEKAQKLVEEGHFFMKKAREADEKSARQLIQNGDEEEFSLHVHYLEPNDAVHHLRLHLTSFSGLSSIHYIKVVVSTHEGDNKERKRKRLITKLLEREGIAWTEEGNGHIISIRVDEIDPKKLSFSKK